MVAGGNHETRPPTPRGPAARAASSTQRRHRDAIAEAQHRLNLEARFKKFDKNGDGQLTREEFVIPDPW